MSYQPVGADEENNLPPAVVEKLGDTFAHLQGEILVIGEEPVPLTGNIDAETAALVRDPNSELSVALVGELDEYFGSADDVAELEELVTEGRLSEDELSATLVSQDGDGNAAIPLGGDLVVTPDDGNAGQRWSLTGVDDTVMPYFQVVASTRTGTDGGGAVAGYQLHLGPDAGSGVNREFFYIEAVGELHSDGPHFRIGTHASGAGVRRPLRIESAGTLSLLFTEGLATNVIQAWKVIESRNQTLVLSARRDNQNVTVVEGITHGGSVAQAWMGRTGGTAASPTAPGPGVPLGSYTFGSMSGTTKRDGAQMRAVTTEAWSVGSAEGTRLEFLIKANGSASSLEAFRITNPANNQAGVMMLINRSGTITHSQVTIGDPDSAGAGFRALRVAN